MKVDNNHRTALFYCPHCSKTQWCREGEVQLCKLCKHCLIQFNEFISEEELKDLVLKNDGKDYTLMLLAAQQKAVQSPEYSPQKHWEKPLAKASVNARIIQPTIRMQTHLEEPSFSPKCPTCGSTAVKRIGFVERAVSVELLGLWSSKLGKTMSCKNCGAKW